MEHPELANLQVAGILEERLRRRVLRALGEQAVNDRTKQAFLLPR